jgi:hypothetical protein
VATFADLVHFRDAEGKNGRVANEHETNAMPHAVIEPPLCYAGPVRSRRVRMMSGS